MIKKDKRVDAYIAKAADFAQPILRHVRGLIHAACPDVEETIKWQHPTFLFHGMICGVAAFKAHCAVGFWKGKLIFGPTEKENEAMGQFGRIMSLADLPKDEVFAGWVKKAMELNLTGAKVPGRDNTVKRPAPVVPEFFKEALRKNKKAGATFDRFSPSHKREYIEWLAEAKREETRQKRLATALQWLTEGKPRHWKYANC